DRADDLGLGAGVALSPSTAEPERVIGADDQGEGKKDPYRPALAAVGRLLRAEGHRLGTQLGGDVGAPRRAPTPPTPQPVAASTSGTDGASSPPLFRLSTEMRVGTSSVGTSP